MNNQHSAFPAKLFEEVYKSFQRAETNKSSKVRYYDIASRIVKLRFAGSAMIPYMTPALNHLKSINRKKILNKFKSVYTPNNLILCVVGDVGFNKLVNFAEKNFG